MIPRVKPPSFPRSDARYAFGRGDKGRPLRIVIDAATVTDIGDVGTDDAVECLHGFAHHPLVEILTTGADKNGLQIGDYDAEADYRPVEFTIGERRIRTGAWSRDAAEIARQLADPAHADEAERAAVLADICGHNDVDALATRSAFLLESAPRQLVAAANPMTPEDAVALVGLYLRSNDDFSVDYGETWRDSLGRHFSYFVLMRELLPAAWRWFSGCVAHSQASGDDQLMMIGQSAMERFDRSLRARDRLHAELQPPMGRESADEARFYFDVALLMLGGAFDGTARVTHFVHKLAPPLRQASWANSNWLRALAKENTELASLMRPEQPARDARELVAVLRNTIHGEATRIVTLHAGGRREELVVVPKSLESEVETLVARQPNADAFGVARTDGGHLYLDPGLYVEALLPRAASALNEIMDATPVEALDGVVAAALMTGPPAEETRNNVFHPALRRRLRLLGGFAIP